jgi:hypothetical protein
MVEMESQTSPDLVTTTEAARRVGLSYRCLSFWLMTDTITVTNQVHGSGNRNRFTHDEMRRLRVLAAVYRDALAFGVQPNSPFIQEIWEATGALMPSDDGVCKSVKVGRIEVDVRGD